MSQARASREVTVLNPQGLHARAADLFARLPSRFVAQVWLIKDEQRANGKSILDILMLAAVEGSHLTIEADGGDAVEAVDALAGLLEREVPVEQVVD